jgi:2-oxoisovalerate dehydrogenase E2 component (dihydrolipoyl transacylase)
MARFEFRLPDIGEGIAEAEVVAWHIKIGDPISEDQPIADMMTDKATVEMESPVSGIVVALAGDVGDMIAIGSTLVVIETDAATDADAPVNVDTDAQEAPFDEAIDAPAAIMADDAASDPLAGSDLETIMPTHFIPEPHPQATEIAVEKPSAQALASAAVRARARDLGVDLSAVKGDADGRVRHADLDAYLRYSAGQGYAAAGVARPDETIKVIGMRRKIAENMQAAKRHIPHFTYVDEVDVTALEAMRADLNANRGNKPKLTLLPLMIVALCKALPKFPMLNARFDDEAGVVTRAGAVHLGMATQTDAGLMVPVIRDAQNRNMWQLAAEIVRLAEAARTGKARPEELSGSTITITSLGPLGGIATTPVINRPEVAIIGPNKIVERPMFKTGADGHEQIVRAKLMNISISCDHRVVDGWDAASFIQHLKLFLETPVLLFAD